MFRLCARIARAFFREQTGQDVTEYSLLLVFVVLCAAALLLLQQDSINTIWSVTNNNLSTAHRCSL